MLRHFWGVVGSTKTPIGPQLIEGMLPNNGIAGDHGHEVRG